MQALDDREATPMCEFSVVAECRTAFRIMRSIAAVKMVALRSCRQLINGQSFYAALYLAPIFTLTMN